MRLTDLLQLTNDLNSQTNFYLKINKKLQPLYKIKITANNCLLYPGPKIMTKHKFYQVVKKLHHRDIAIFVITQQEKFPIYGIQIRPEINSIVLT